MSESIVTPGELLCIETTFDRTYTGDQAHRAYGWQIVNLDGVVISYCYHCTPTADAAADAARQRFGAEHDYHVQEA